MEYQHIGVDERDGFVAITMRRPERRNALSEPHLSELLHAFRVTGASKARGIVLAAEGPRAGRALRRSCGRESEERAASREPLELSPAGPISSERPAVGGAIKRSDRALASSLWGMDSLAPLL